MWSPAEFDSSLPRPNVIRKRNQRIAGAALLHRFDPSAHVPFLCECTDDRCEEIVRLTLDDLWYSITH